MADPLSITLAAITLATALKDVVELAQKLNDSFEKHARNMRAAQLLAADTLEIVQDLEEFHERHREALDDAKEVRDAVVTLLGDMKSVYEKCLPITQVSKPLETKWERMKRFMRLWLDRQELEMSVHYLRDQAKKCRSRFKMRIQLGTVAAVVELKTVVKAGHMGHGRTQFGPTNSELSLRRFVRPSSSQISTLPPDVVLSEDVVYKLHIRIHVGKLDSIFKVLALRRLSPIEEPDHYHSSDIVVEDVMPPSTSEAVDHLRGETMVNIIRAQQELNVQSDDVSMQRGALAATRLSVDLYYLEMYEEAITLGQWAIDLYRSLTSRSNRQDAYTPHLALALSMLSKELAQLHDRGQSRTLISECLAVLKSCTPTFGVEIFTAETLSYSAYSHGLGIDHPETLPKLQDAAARFDRLLSGENQYTLDASVSPQEHVIYIKPPEVNIGHYARALKRLCLCLCVAGRFREALDPGLKALELFRVLASRYKGDLLTHTHIAHLCMSLCLGRSILAFTPAQALTYAEEAIQYWETASKTTAKNSEDLLNCFMEKAKILMDLERFDDAFKAFQKAAGVIHSMDNYQWTQLEKLEVSSEWFYNTGNYYLAEQASKVVVDLCRQYVRRFPSQQNSFVLVILMHTRHCEAANHLSEGVTHMREVIDSVEPQNILIDLVLAANHLRCYSWVAYLLIEQGLPGDSLAQCEKAIKMFSPPTSKQTACDILDVITWKMRSLLALDRLSLALGVARKGQRFAALHGLWETREYALLCFLISFVHRRAGETDKAIVTIKTAGTVWEKEGWMLPLHALSHLKADLGEDLEAHDIAKKALERTEHEAQAYSFLPYERRYRDAQYSFSLRLFYNGELARARQLIIEVRGFYEWHAHSRNAWFVDLAIVLRAEGILECASGRHGEGAAARTRLCELRSRLRVTSPGLADQVDVALKYEEGYPEWKRLFEKYPVACSHQSESK